MSEHFIKNIEIKDFKCFKDFKAEGFGRVNLIGGKNNVGKTAFMEACYLTLSRDKEESLKRIITTRYISDIFIDMMKEMGNKYINNFINEKKEIYKINQIKTNIDDLKLNLKFISKNKQPKGSYEFFYSQIIKQDLEEEFELYLKEFDSSIKKFRILNGEPSCQLLDNKFYNLNELGDGIGKIILLIIIVLSQQNSILFIDEIENGIHYTNLNKLWKMILTISKQQNVQVFATTHSKEAIESYARVAKKLEDEDIKFISLYRDRENELKSITFDYEKIQNRIELGLDNR